MARMRVGPLPRDKEGGEVAIATLAIGRVVSSPPANQPYYRPLDQCSRSSDLVERGVGNLEGFQLRSSVNELLQDLGHCGVTAEIVVVGALLGVPQTHTESFGAACGNERDFIPKPALFAKHGDDFLFQPLGKLDSAVRLQLHGYATCIHAELLGCEGQGGVADNHC